MNPPGHGVERAIEPIQSQRKVMLRHTYCVGVGGGHPSIGQELAHESDETGSSVCFDHEVRLFTSADRDLQMHHADGDVGQCEPSDHEIIAHGSEGVRLA